MRKSFGSCAAAPPYRMPQVGHADRRIDRLCIMLNKAMMEISGFCAPITVHLQKKSSSQS